MGSKFLPPTRSLSRYSTIGISLIIVGILIITTSYLIQRNIGLIALGIASLLMGATVASLPTKLESSESMRMMLQEVALSTEKILEGLYGSNSSKETSEVRDPAKKELACVFLPPVDGIMSVYLSPRTSLTTERSPHISSALMMSAPFATSRIIEGNPEGVRVYPVGFTVGKIPELSGGSSSGLLLQEALSFFLVEKTQICSSVGFSELGETLIIELKGVRFDTEAMLYHRYIGSISASLAACIVATVRSKPVTIVDETSQSDLKVIRLRILNE
jgi:hypothetical protein